jgi:hypothetical protein
MNSMLLLLCFLVTLSSRPAFADLPQAGVPLCEDPNGLLEKAESCEGNSAFTNAANACLAKLNAQESAWGFEVEKVAKAAEYGQATDTSSAEKSYGVTVTAMTQLLALAGSAAKEMQDYQNYTALPGFEYAPPGADLQSESGRWEMQVDCYGKTIKKLREVAAEFQRKIALYGKRRKDAIADGKALAARRGALTAQGKSASGAKKDAGSPGPVLRPSGNSGQQGSQVTGKGDDQLK